MTGRKKVWYSSWSKAYNIICETSSVMTWACMVSSGTGLLVFINDKTEAAGWFLKCIWIYSAQIRSDGAKFIGWCFIVQMDNDPKHTAKAKGSFWRLKKWNILQWPSQSPDFNPIEHAFHFLKTKLKAERPTNKQQLKSAAVKSWQSITEEETRLWWYSWAPDSRQSLPAKDSQHNIQKEHFIYVYIYLSNYIWVHENGGGGYKNGCNCINIAFYVIFLFNLLN